jgi:hypothetical protein
MFQSWPPEQKTERVVGIGLGAMFVVVGLMITHIEVPSLGWPVAAGGAFVVALCCLLSKERYAKWQRSWYLWW